MRDASDKVSRSWSIVDSNRLLSRSMRDGGMGSMVHKSSVEVSMTDRDADMNYLPRPSMVMEMIDTQNWRETREDTLMCVEGLVPNVWIKSNREQMYNRGNRITSVTWIFLSPISGPRSFSIHSSPFTTSPLVASGSVRLVRRHIYKASNHLLGIIPSLSRMHRSRGVSLELPV